MTIQLQDDAVPYYVNGARPIPFADRLEVKKLLDDYVEQGLIAPVEEATDWAAPLVVLRRSNGKLRIVVDHPVSISLRLTNHPPHSNAQAFRCGQQRAFLHLFRCRKWLLSNSLHQSNQILKTFMIHWGRLKFLRASMGLSCSGEEYNHRTDMAFAGQVNTVRVVDDLLRFDRDFPAHVKGVCAFLHAARKAARPASP